MYQTLYRKWRPKSFDDVCGQEHVTRVLLNEITENKTSHAYLFCGSRGTGKTTCAKLLARALNCENPQNGNPCGVCEVCRGIESGRITDVVEMDAASNNGVDNIRDIRDDVMYAPTECRKRVFIIDEVHMLSTSAFNALLKTLEEPPEHIVFILATTEMHKIPATILSRCQRFDFRRIHTGVIASRLRTIADAEGIAIEDDALYLIAKVANGGMRDAIGMLELCAGAAGDAPLSSSDAASLIGTSPIEMTASVVSAIRRHDIGGLFEKVDTLYRDSRDIGVFWQSLISFYRDMLVAKTVSDPAPFLDLPESQITLPVSLAKEFPLGTLLRHTKILDEILTVLQRGAVPARVTVEMALVRLCDDTLDTDNTALLSRIAALEDKIALGGFSASVPEPAAPVAGDVPETVFREPAVIPEETPAPKKTPVSGAPVLRAFRGWQDAVRRLEDSSPEFIGFLRGYKVYTCEEDGKIHLIAGDPLSPSLLSANKDAMNALRDAVNIVSQGKKYKETEFVIETGDKIKTSGYELIDELIGEAGEINA